MLGDPIAMLATPELAVPSNEPRIWESCCSRPGGGCEDGAEGAEGAEGGEGVLGKVEEDDVVVVVDVVLEEVEVFEVFEVEEVLVVPPL